MKLDHEKLQEYGKFLLTIKLFPYFDIAHYILMCLVVREDIHLYQTSIPNFHKRHPLACYMSSMLLCFGGPMVTHFLLGEPILDDFKTHQNLLIASVVWYLVFFSPFDLFYKVVKFLPVKMVLSACKELQRTRKIYDGVLHGLHLYPNSYVIIVAAGAMKGAGASFLTIIERFNRGLFLPNTGEFLHPSFATKGSILAAVLFTLERSKLIEVHKNLLFLCVAGFMMYVKLMSLFLKSFDPFIPFENLTAAVFFGGIMDALRRAKKSSKASTVPADDKKVTDVDSKKTN